MNWPGTKWQIILLSLPVSKQTDLAKHVVQLRSSLFRRQRVFMQINEHNRNVVNTYTPSTNKQCPYLVTCSCGSNTTLLSRQGRRVKRFQLTGPKRGWSMQLISLLFSVKKQWREHSSPWGLWAYHWVFTDLHILHRPHPSHKERPLDGQLFSTSTGQLPNLEHLNLVSRESLVFYGCLTYTYCRISVYSKPMEDILLPFPFNRWGSWGSGRLAMKPRLT